MTLARPRPRAKRAPGASASPAALAERIHARTSVPPVGLFLLGLCAAAKAAGLVLVAEAIARGIAGVQAGDLDVRLVMLLGVGGALLRAFAGWATQVAARRIASAVKQDLRGRLWRTIALGGATRASGRGARSSAVATDGPDRTAGQGGLVVLASEGLDDLDEYYTQSLPAMIAAVAVPAIVGLRILGADWVSAIIVVLTIPLVPVFMILIGKHTQDHVDEATGALSRLADHLAELARGLPVLVGLGRVDDQTRALDRIQRDYRERTMATLRTAFLSALALELIATLSVAVVAVFLGLRLLYGTIELAPALLALILAPEIYGALRDVGTAFHASQSGMSALQRVKDVVGRPLRRDVRVMAGDESESIDGRAGGQTSPAAVRLRGLGVTYAGRDRPVLEAVDADLVGLTAITGPSGAGKSTLLGALADALPHDAQVSGSIELAGGVGWAPQAPRAFAATPIDELAVYGASSPLAALAELGLEHVADASVAELSPGELRRLAVARALARVDAGATLLVLDEPTAHLDRASADRVRAAILRRAERATVVFATHEPETLALATASVAVGDGAGGGLGDQLGDGAGDGLNSAPAALRSARLNSVASGDSDRRPGTGGERRSGSGGERLSEGIGERRPGGGGFAADGERGSGLGDGAGEQLGEQLGAGLGHGLNSAPAALRSARLNSVASGDSDRRPGGGDAGRRTRGRRARLRSILRPAGWSWVGAVALGVIATGLGLSLTGVSGWLIVRASVEEYIMYLLVAIVGVRFFGLGRSVARYLERLATHDAAFRAVDAMRIRLWRGIASRGAGSRRLLDGGSPLDYLVTQANSLRDQLPRTIPPIVVGVLSLAGITVATAFVAPPLAPLVGGVLAGAATVGVICAVLAERGASAAGVAERGAIVRGTAALASAADDLRGSSAAPFAPGSPTATALGRLDATGARLARAEQRTAWGAGLGAAVATLATSLLAAAVAPLAAQHGVAAEPVAVVALLALAALDPAAGLIAASQRVPTMRAALDRISPVLEPAASALAGAQDLDGPTTLLELDEVAAGYGAAHHGRTDAEIPVFSGVSARVKRGEWLVVEGPSGSGKSTLLSTLMGALPTSSGRIRANGAELGTLSPDAWRRRVAWCPQDAYVFDSTLRGNLLLARSGDDAPTEREQRLALESAGLGGLLSQLPDGLDTRVGAGGAALSGGERQRLAVARALLSRADVLLLDEPTSHLDAPTAAAMMRDIRAASAERITVLVSHRGADRASGDTAIRLGRV